MIEPIKFQEGTVKDVGVNGWQIEEVIDTLIDRLYHFQLNSLQCYENTHAILNLEDARRWLKMRTADRKRQGVEGTMNIRKGGG